MFSKYSIPEYLSPDRAASIIASRYLFKKRGCTIFDFGTTLTEDFLDPDGVYAGGYISQNNMSFYEANEIMESGDEIAAYEQLKNSFILMFSGTPGNFDWELEFFEGDPVLDYGVMYLDGLTQLMGQTIPLIWISENMTVTVTKFDMANQKLSLTLTATMRDMVSLMMGASGNDQGAKTFTLSVKNYPMSDWGLEDLEKFTTKMKKLK